VCHEGGALATDTSCKLLCYYRQISL
jgi:hypothetical protein